MISIQYYNQFNSQSKINKGRKSQKQMIFLFYQINQEIICNMKKPVTFFSYGMFTHSYLKLYYQSNFNVSTKS